MANVCNKLGSAVFFKKPLFLKSQIDILNSDKIVFNHSKILSAVAWNDHQSRDMMIAFLVDQNLKIG